MASLTNCRDTLQLIGTIETEDYRFIRGLGEVPGFPKTWAPICPSRPSADEQADEGQGRLVAQLHHCSGLEEHPLGRDLLTSPEN